jgi:hypothetical protein
MKKIILAFVLIGITSASADIIRPSNIKTRSLTGTAAKELFSSLGGESIPGDSLRTESSSYKVSRSDDGLKQTVCEETIYVSRKPSLYRCTVQKSVDGVPVPVFTAPLRRLG